MGELGGAKMETYHDEHILRSVRPWGGVENSRGWVTPAYCRPGITGGRNASVSTPNSASRRRCDSLNRAE